MEFSVLIKELKSGQIKPVYFLHGEESYFIDEIVHYIEKNVLSDAEKAFNQAVVYGKESDFKQVLDLARQFPMMSERRVVIIKEAQEMLNACHEYLEASGLTHCKNDFIIIDIESEEELNLAESI